MSSYRRYAARDEQLQEDGDERFLGVNARLAPESLPPGMLAMAVNARLRDGEAKTRLGVVKPAWLNLILTIKETDPDTYQIVPVTALDAAGVFMDPSSVEWVLIVSEGVVYRCLPHNIRQSLPMPTGVKVARPCSFTQAFNKMFLWRGRHLAPLVMHKLNNGFVDIVAHWDKDKTYNGTVLETGQQPDEVAFGPFIDGLVTNAGGWATVTTEVDHGYVSGADIVVTGASIPAVNGRFNIEVTGERTFRYTYSGEDILTGLGLLVKVSNMSQYWRALGTQVTNVSLVVEVGGGTVTATTVGKHKFVEGQYVTIEGATGPKELDAAASYYNGTFIITAPVNDYDFRYELGFSPSETGAATGDITARSSVVQVGQSPTTVPNPWKQIYNMLPNADDAVFINNRLLVPTAYTPGLEDYDSTSTYRKKDYIVATDIQDYLHFDFDNEFRINEGSDDEIICQVKYNDDTLVVFKEKSWGILTGIAMDLSNLSLDMHGDGYGACALRGALIAGKNVLFPSLKRGVCSLQQNQQGQTRSVDMPFSNDFQRVIDRINWNQARLIRMAWWNDCLYVAVPLDNGATNNAILVYDFRMGEPGNEFSYDSQSGQWAGYDNGQALCVTEFFKAQYNGLERLFFLGADGFVNMMEEAEAGDQVLDATYPPAPQGLKFEEIETMVDTRGYRLGMQGPKRWRQLNLVADVWNAQFSISASSGAVAVERTIRQDISFSRLKYLKPVGKADYIDGNFNQDFTSPGRGNYSVPLLSYGVQLGEGIAVHLFQEIITRANLSTFEGRWVQLRMTNTTGRVSLKAVAPVGFEGLRRRGILIG